MWALKGFTEERSWIPGVFLQKGDAEKCQRQLSQSDDGEFILLPLYRAEFPLVVMYTQESPRDLRILEMNVADRVLKKEGRKGLEGKGKRWIIYTITEPFAPSPVEDTVSKASSDWHVHMDVTEDYQRFMKNGIRQLNI